MKTLINIKKLLKVIALSFLVSLLSTACNNSNDSSNNTSVSKQLATQSADSEPGELDDPIAIMSDINTLFGKPDDEPVDIETGETLTDIFGKVGHNHAIFHVFTSWKQ